MRTIWKFSVGGVVVRHSTISMPKGAKVLDAQLQGKELAIWAEVETNNVTVQRDVVIFGTGSEIPDAFEGEYIGTIQCDGMLGTLVWHVYVLPEES